MKKSIVFLLSMLTMVSPVMSIHASNIEAPANEVFAQEGTDTSAQPEEAQGDEERVANEETEPVSGSEEPASAADDAEPTNVTTQVAEQETLLTTSNFALKTIVEGEFTYYLDQSNHVKYREHRKPGMKSVDYAEEYYSGTIYGRDNLARGKKSIYIKMTNDRDQLVAYRARVEQGRQVWHMVEEYKQALPWRYGHPYEWSMAREVYVLPDNTIKWAHTFGSDWKRPTGRIDYEPGTMYGDNHANKVVSTHTDFNKLWTFKKGEFVYYSVTNSGEVKYREHRKPGMKTVDYAEEYYPGTIVWNGKPESGKKSIYIKMTNDRDQLVAYRARVEQGRQVWHLVEEYKQALPWRYGRPYEWSMAREVYVLPDNTIKWAHTFGSDWKKPTGRIDYEPGTMYGDNHANKVVSTHTNFNKLWTFKKGEFVYYSVTNSGEVKYREHRKPGMKTVDYAEEYYPGTIVWNGKPESGKKSIYIQMTNDRDQLVAYRTKIDKNTQHGTEVEEYKKALKWDYGFPYEYQWTIRFFVEGDKTIKYAYVYGNDWKKPTTRLDYYAGTKYGEGHRSKERYRNTQNWNIVDGEYRIHMNYLGEVKYREHLSRRTGKVDSAVEYYPGTIYKRDNLNRGHSIYIQMRNDTDQQVHYRARIDKNTQYWTEVEEYHELQPWRYGRVYEDYYQTRYFLTGSDRTIKWADRYAYKNPREVTHRVEFHRGTKYGANHWGRVAKEDDLRQKWVWPVNSWTISTNYLRDPAPCNSSSGGPNCYPHSINGGRHYGIDIAASIGTEVWAANKGEIISSGRDGSRGNYIIIKHDGDIYSNYYHLNGFVRTGGWVASGELIGYVGSTGAAYGPHLHFQMGRGGYGNGNSINPAEYIPGMKWNYSMNIMDMIIEQEEKKRREASYMMTDFIV